MNTLPIEGLRQITQMGGGGIDPQTLILLAKSAIITLASGLPSLWVGREASKHIPERYRPLGLLILTLSLAAASQIPTSPHPSIALALSVGGTGFGAGILIGS